MVKLQNNRQVIYRFARKHKMAMCQAWKEIKHIRNIKTRPNPRACKGVCGTCKRNPWNN